MTVEISTFVRDILFFIKNDFLSSIDDPISTSRNNNSSFIMTSYPQRLAVYPMITLKVTNYNGVSSGMQTGTTDVVAFIEIRVWARNEKEKETLATACYNRLKNIQFASGGSRENYLYFFTLLSAPEVDEPGEEQPKSRILNIRYNFYNA